MRTQHARRSSLALLVVALVAAAVGVQGVGPQPAQAQEPAGIDWGDPLPPAGTTRLGDAPGGTDVPVLLAFDPDGDGLEAVATAVSDPASPTYGQHRTVADLAAAFGGISAADLAALVDGLAGLGVAPEVDPTGAFATPTPTVDQLEDLLGVTFGLYELTEGSTTVQVIAPDALPATTPPALAGVTAVRGLDLVLPTTPGPPPPAPTPAALAGGYPVDGGTPTRTGTPHGCPEALAVTNPVVPGATVGLAPGQLHTAYGVDELHEAGLRGQGVRVALVEAGPFRQPDLDTFTECFGIEATRPVVHGAQPESANSVEATLDVQVLAALVPEAERIDVFQNPLDTSWQIAPFLSAPLDAAAMGGRLPHLVSVSYGFCEPELDGDLAAVALSEYVLATAAAAGVGYHVAAGDSGSSACYHNIGTDQLSVGYPATSQWVTAVGGTNLTLHEDNTIAGQGVWNDLPFFSSPPSPSTQAGGTGGLSTLLERPAWQQGATVPAGTVRAVPDVALFADSYPGWIIYCTIPDVGFCPAGGWTTVGGTSAAAPLFVGIAALATQATLADGQPALGFASPLLYALAGDAEDRAAVLRDVVLGGNDLFDVGCCTAAPGYDLASGWGSVDATALAVALGAPVVGVEARPGEGVAGSPATFHASAATPAGEVLAWRWDVNGDGVVDEVTDGPTLTVTFERPGTWEVGVTAATSLGRTASAATPFAVVAAPPGPPRPPRFTG